MDIRIYLADQLADTPEGPRDAVEIYILPSSNNWNDFGYSLMAEVVVRYDGQVLRFARGVKVIVDDQDDTSVYLKRIKGRRDISAEADRTGLLTFLGREEYYEKILNAFSPEHARDVLMAMRDVAALYHYALHEPLYDAALHSAKVQKSFLRTSEAYLAFIGLEKCIVRVRATREGRGKITELAFLESVSKSGSLMGIRFEPDDLGENLIHAVIGCNGLGKTRVLMDVAASLCGRKPPGVSDANAEWVSEFLRFIRRRRVVVFSHEPGRWEMAKEWGVKVKPLNVFGEAWTGLTQPLYNLARGTYNDNSTFGWAALRRIALAALPIRDLCFPLQGGGYVPTSSIGKTFVESELETARRVDVTKAVAFLGEDGESFEISSGQKVILSFLTQLFTEAVDQTVFLFDEPEVHLHPQFISLVMVALHDALIATRSVAIIATHSPYVIRELDKSCVTVLRPAPEERVEFAQPTLQTRGGDLSEISEFVFEHGRAGGLTRSRLFDYVRDSGASAPASLVRKLSGLVGSEGLNLIPALVNEGRDA
ncbi:AAA family ATPase [Cupriavidus necator]